MVVSASVSMSRLTGVGGDALDGQVNFSEALGAGHKRLKGEG
jgi:hypothetical protein